MPDRARWQATSAWPDAPCLAASSDADLRVAPVEGLALATLIVRRGHERDFAHAARATLGCDVPEPGKVGFGTSCDLVWSAPGQWLAVASTDETFAKLRAALAGPTAITDQSDSRALVRVSGASAREVLAKGFAIDLHPKVFAAGSTAVTKVAHLSVQIWQVDAVPTYLIAVPRSFAGSFWSWLGSACEGL